MGQVIHYSFKGLPICILGAGSKSSGVTKLESEIRKRGLPVYEVNGISSTLYEELTQFCAEIALIGDTDQLPIDTIVSNALKYIDEQGVADDAADTEISYDDIGQQFLMAYKKEQPQRMRMTGNSAVACLVFRNIDTLYPADSPQQLVPIHQAISLLAYSRYIAFIAVSEDISLLWQADCPSMLRVMTHTMRYYSRDEYTQAQLSIDVNPSVFLESVQQGKAATVDAMTTLAHVLSAVPLASLHVFQSLAELQLGNRENMPEEKAVGVLQSELIHACRLGYAMALSTTGQLQSHLREFIDHDLVVWDQGEIRIQGDGDFLLSALERCIAIESELTAQK